MAPVALQWDTLNTLVLWPSWCDKTEHANWGENFVPYVYHHSLRVISQNKAIVRINHYPSRKAIGSPNTQPLDNTGGLSCGYRYPAFEQPGPDTASFPGSSPTRKSQDRGNEVEPDNVLVNNSHSLSGG